MYINIINHHYTSMYINTHTHNGGFHSPWGSPNCRCDAWRCCRMERGLGDFFGEKIGGDSIAMGVPKEIMVLYGLIWDNMVLVWFYPGIS